MTLRMTRVSAMLGLKAAPVALKKIQIEAMRAIAMEVEAMRRKDASDTLTC